MLYRCKFRARSIRRFWSSGYPESALVVADSAATAQRLVEPYAAFRGWQVVTVTPADRGRAAAW